MLPARAGTAAQAIRVEWPRSPFDEIVAVDASAALTTYTNGVDDQALGAVLVSKELVVVEISCPAFVDASERLDPMAIARASVERLCAVRDRLAAGPSAST